MPNPILKNFSGQIRRIAKNTSDALYYALNRQHFPKMDKYGIMQMPASLYNDNSGRPMLANNNKSTQKLCSHLYKTQCIQAKAFSMWADRRAKQTDCESQKDILLVAKTFADFQQYPISTNFKIDFEKLKTAICDANINLDVAYKLAITLDTTLPWLQLWKAYTPEQNKITKKHILRATRDANMCASDKLKYIELVLDDFNRTESDRKKILNVLSTNPQEDAHLPAGFNINEHWKKMEQLFDMHFETSHNASQDHVREL